MHIAGQTVKTRKIRLKTIDYIEGSGLKKARGVNSLFHTENRGCILFTLTLFGVTDQNSAFSGSGMVAKNQQI